MKINWKKYIDKTADRPPRDILIEAVKHVSHKGRALDLGAGALMDSKYLLEIGFEDVCAVNMDEGFIPYAQKIKHANFSYMHESLLNLQYPKNTYDLVNAQRVFPFLNEHEFASTIDRVLDSIKPGGVFAGMFFGPNDEQILPDEVHMTRLSAKKLRSIFTQFDIITLQESESDHESARGTMKHWHEIGIISKKQ